MKVFLEGKLYGATKEQAVEEIMTNFAHEPGSNFSLRLKEFLTVIQDYTAGREEDYILYKVPVKVMQSVLNEVMGKDRLRLAMELTHEPGVNTPVYIKLALPPTSPQQ